ncbi:MAG TPA: hypothetical protein EYO02_00275 [Rhodospirillales bacterium]|nr:hypothetical protein [Rhodospirillales bacterium]HIN53451.1 hypothetical protein [Planctomycetota bacterium]
MAEDVQINWGKVKNIFESVTERMGQNPDRPAIGAPKAKVRVIKERLFEAKAEGHTFQIDEPVERGGNGLAPSPMAYFTAGAAACLTSHITQSAGFLETHYTSLEVEATVLWDNRRKFSIADLAQASLGIIYNIHMESDEPEDKLIALLKHAEDGCYASDVVRNETPLRAHLIVNGDEMYVHKNGAEIPDVPAGPTFGDNPTGMSKDEIAAKKRDGG